VKDGFVIAKVFVAELLAGRQVFNGGGVDGFGCCGWDLPQRIASRRADSREWKSTFNDVGSFGLSPRLREGSARKVPGAVGRPSDSSSRAFIGRRVE